MSDIHRILNVPQEDLQPKAEELARKWTERLRRHKRAPPLKPLQGVALEAAHLSKPPQGFLAALGVGTGKTLISMLLPEVAGLERPILLLDPQGIESALRERNVWSRHYFIRRLEMIPYSQLSSPRSSRLLDKLRPDGIIADECHALKSDSAARTRRFLRYMVERENTRLFAMTGTLTTGSVRDYHHLAALALREESPLPFDPQTMSHWASVLSEGGKPSGLSWAMLRPLARWAGVAERTIEAAIEDKDKATFQRAYARRFATCPGVITSLRGSTESTLAIHRYGRPLPRGLAKTLSDVESRWKTPDGEDIVETLEMVRLRRQLVQGFYYRPDWGEREPDPEYLDARRGWAREARAWVQWRSFPGCDSPGLLGDRIRSRPEWAKTNAPAAWNAWTEWQAVKDREPPEKEAVWLDYAPLLDTVAVAERIRAEGETAILWFAHRAVGEALYGLGIPTRWEGYPDPRSERIVALSIPVYHRIWNLQAWGANIIIPPVSSGETFEQLTGRTHRQGQMRDTVSLYINVSNWVHAKAWKKAGQKAEAIQNLTKNPQKILNAGSYGHGLAPEIPS